jgi:NADH:ubiquinone oxidoreductase subunit H
LPEAESELVAGFMTEHSAVGFVYFFLGEYTNIITISTLMVIFFFGGVNIFLNSLLVVFVLFLVIWVRSTLPRVRLDHLFKLGWANILPFTIAFIIFIPCIIFSFDLLG